MVPLNGTINQVRAAVCDALSDVKASNLHICDIWSNRIHKTWKWSESLVDIRPTDMTYVYELEHTITRASSARTADVLFSRRVKNDRQGNQSPSFQSFAVPWRFSYTTSTCRQARAMIVAHCSSLVKEEERSRFSCDDTGTFFRVVESNSQGTDLTYDLPNNDSVFSLSKGRALTLIWTRAGCLLLKDQDPPNRRERRTAENGQSADRSSVDLLDCFKLYAEREKLGKDDTWYCPKCKHHVEAYKKIDLWTVPDVLIIHLKRFQYTPGTYFIHRQKIDALVNFPLDCLDLSEVIVGPKDAPVYELYAVSEHIGGMGGGHYTAVVKNMRNARWYSFNDTQVSETQAEATLTPQAYVLFYRRKDRGMRWGGIRLPSEKKGSKRAP